MTAIGVMQGRLSAPVDGQIQCFPVATWRQEFHRAREAGLDCIEWIYDLPGAPSNPLGNDAGVEEMRQLAAASGVKVLSVCADYYMVEHLISPAGDANAGRVDHLQWLIGRAQLLGVRYIVLPFVDASALRSAAAVRGLHAALARALPTAERFGVELHLETDLTPAPLADIYRTVGHPLLRANYDTGNSASLGYDPEEELTVLAEWLGSVHIKDRLRGGSTVPLGTGATRFAPCFRLFADAQFRGPYILQVARGTTGQEVEHATRNRAFVEECLQAVGAGRGGVR